MTPSLSLSRPFYKKLFLHGEAGYILRDAIKIRGILARCFFIVLSINRLIVRFFPCLSFNGNSMALLYLISFVLNACHAEFISASVLKNQILNQVQDDNQQLTTINSNCLPPKILISVLSLFYPRSSVLLYM